MLRPITVVLRDDYAADVPVEFRMFVARWEEVPGHAENSAFQIARPIAPVLFTSDILASDPAGDKMLARAVAATKVPRAQARLEALRAAVNLDRFLSFMDLMFQRPDCSILPAWDGLVARGR